MKINIDQLKKKIIYRSNYRGTKEMDKLLGAFTNKYIDKLSIENLYYLEKLLHLDTPWVYYCPRSLRLFLLWQLVHIGCKFSWLHLLPPNLIGVM